jgi:hypothetical protein
MGTNVRCPTFRARNMSSDSSCSSSRSVRLFGAKELHGFDRYNALFPSAASAHGQFVCLGSLDLPTGNVQSIHTANSRADV